LAPIRETLRVRYGECDPQGVVFNANYLLYADVAATELWRAAIGGYDALPRDYGVDVLVAAAQVRFLSPLHHDDEIDLEAGIVRTGNTSFVIGTRIWRGEELVAEIRNRAVFIEPGGNTKTPMPNAIRAKLEAFAVDWAAEID